MKPVLQLILTIFLLGTTVSNAQKLPNVQTKSVYAPADIKINGKTSEWNDEYQAYNRVTELFYTISNDDKNVYLTAKAKEKEIIDKIIRGGITWIINREANKKSKNYLSVTYPAIEGPPMWETANKFGRVVNARKNNEVVSINELNDFFAKREKMITVTGIKEIPDSSISKYNTDGIATASLFDEQLTYTYELAIPIKYLNLPANNEGTFNYQIKVNPAPSMKKPIKITADMPPPPPPVTDGTQATTDFKGKYTLAKKP